MQLECLKFYSALHAAVTRHAGLSWNQGINNYVAMNAAQYQGGLACGLCLMYRCAPKQSAVRLLVSELVTVHCYRAHESMQAAVHDAHACCQKPDTQWVVLCAHVARSTSSSAAMMQQPCCYGPAVSWHPAVRNHGVDVQPCSVSFLCSGSLP